MDLNPIINEFMPNINSKKYSEALTLARTLLNISFITITIVIKTTTFRTLV
jgi:hypothetical protein